jgi:hypothetical protein
MEINGEPFTSYELGQWEQSLQNGTPVRNVNLFMKIMSVMAGAILGWWWHNPADDSNINNIGQK